MNSIEPALMISLAVFIIGIFGVLLRKNILFIMMSIQLMLNAGNILLISGSHHTKNLDGQVFVFFVMLVAICEATIGLAMVIALHRRYGILNIDFFRLLRG